MKNYIFLLLLVFNYNVNAQQENYSNLTTAALKKMWEAKDSTGYRTSLAMYESAFKIYPDSINIMSLYKASVLASELKDCNKAFEYLTLLSQKETGNGKYAAWEYILGDYSEDEYKNLLHDPRWTVLKQKASVHKTEFYTQLKKNEKEFFQVTEEKKIETQNAEKLYQELREYHTYLPKKLQDYSISFKINHTVKTSFLLHLPKNYNPQKKYSVLFFLHGAIRNNVLVDYQSAESNLDGWNRFYAKYAALHNIILIFPRGNSTYNWMSPDDGFFMVPEILKLVKKSINIDDNKIFISGHSNGATGSFSYLMKKPTSFSGFYGFNTYPKVFTGGTFIENIKNRSFINFSTDLDYYYPPNANDDLTKLMKSVKADYKDFRYNGFPHWFPQFNESEEAYKILFSDLLKRERNPFPKNINWEFDDNQYGNIDWLADVALDSLSQKAEWHTHLNFKINKWLIYDKKDSLITENVDKNAFNFPRKSGKIIANYQNNTFTIETSCIKSFKISISPEMIDTKKKVKVYVNKKLYFNKRIQYNSKLMLQNFNDNHDREQVWVNFIPITI